MKKRYKKKFIENSNKEILRIQIEKELGYSNLTDDQIFNWRGNNLKAEKLIKKFKKLYY